MIARSTSLWHPNLDGIKTGQDGSLPKPLTDAVRTAYDLIYALRGLLDSLNLNAGGISNNGFEWVSVKDSRFGAKGDGAADDTMAIQSAIDYCIAKKVGLFFPSGIYNITGLHVTDSICMFGCGMENVILQNSSSVNPTIYVHGVDDTHVIGMAAPFTGVSISGMQLLGDPAKAVNGLELAFIERSSFKDLMIQQHGRDGVSIGFSFSLEFTNCQIIQNRRDGYRLDKTLHAGALTDDQNDIYINGGSVIGNYGRGWNLVGGGQRNWIVGVDFEANHYEAVLAQRPYGLFIQSFFENNGREQNADTIKTTVGGGAAPGFGLQVRNCRTYGSGSQTGVPNPYNATPANTWSINLGAMYDAVIDGNEFGNSYAGAIEVDSACVGTMIGTNYYSGESTNVSDAGFGTIRFGNDKYNSSILQAAVFQNFVETMYWTSDFQQSIWRSRKNNPVVHYLTSPSDKQSTIIFQNHATAHATIVAGVITAIVIDIGGFYGAQTAVATISGDGSGATLGAVTMGGGKVTAIAVSAGGTGYTTATVEITPANNYQFGRQLLAAAPAATDVGVLLFDVINAWSFFEGLINGNLSLNPAGGVTLVGTHTAFDGATLFQVNGTGTFQGSLKAVTAMVLTWLAGGGTRPIGVDNSGNVVVSTTSPVNHQEVVATSSALAFTTSYVDIPGATLTLNATGTWLITACGILNVDPIDTTSNIQLLANGSAQTGLISENSTGTSIEAHSVSRTWTYAATSGHVVKIQGKKNSGVGASGTANNWGLLAIQLS